jgi:hypothetical protein
MNNEIKRVYSQLISAIENKDEKRINNLILKMRLFTIHNHKVFLRLTEIAIRHYRYNYYHHRDKKVEMKSRIARNNEINDKIRRNEEYSWEKIYGKKLSAVERIKTILLELINF